MKIASHIGALLAVSTALGLGLLTFLFQGAVKVLDEERQAAADNVDIKEVEGLEDSLRFYFRIADLSLSGPHTYLAEQAGELAEGIQGNLEEMDSLPLVGLFDKERALIGESTATVARMLGGIMHIEGEDRMREVGLLEEEVDAELVLLRSRVDDLVKKVETKRAERAKFATANRERLMLQGGVGALLYICLVILLWRWTAKTVIDPLRELTAEASKAEEGEQEMAPLTGGPREVRVLARTISGLVQSLGQHQEVLEETVKQRTQELVRANEDLLEEIVQRERAEDALREHEEKKREDHKMEALGRLAGGVAHDFNNLLTAIVGYSDLSLSRMNPEDPEYESLEQIRLAGDRASVLTRQLLLLGRKQIAAPVSLSLGAVAMNMEKILQSMLGEKVTLTLDVQPELQPIKAEQGQLEQVLVNLTVNARDAIEGYGTVNIRVGKEEDTEDLIHIIVEDDGSGMDQETQARMFEPYFSTKPLDKGTGLGLSIVYGIVQQNGGSMEVQSELGQGTTMKVLLPTTDEPAVNQEVVQESAPESREKKRILLVEDEEVVRGLASSTLKFAGYEVTQASDGEDALEVFKEHDGGFDLVITDVVMPRMSGRDLMRKVAVSVPDMKVLYMSGHIADDELQAEITKDDVPYLPKPFKPSELTQKVSELFGEA
ncbi:MAG: response regulator [Planctomycetes bacterium]|nr:response regulator [Planctomycetota bacterium]